MELAHKNRHAAAGVFVMAKSHAPVGFPGFAKYGNTVLVTWDDSDSSQDAYLHAAIIMALGLVARRQAKEDEGDISAMQDVERRIREEISRLDKIRGFNDKIRKNSDNLGEELRKGENKLDLLLRQARSTLKSLSVELADEEAEVREPVGSEDSSLARATAALGAEGQAAGASA